MTTIENDLKQEMTRRRERAKACRIDALLHRLIAPALASHFWFQATQNDNIADEIEALIASRT